MRRLSTGRPSGEGAPAVRTRSSVRTCCSPGGVIGATRVWPSPRFVSQGRAMATFGWKVVHGGRTPPPGEAVAPDERLSWGRTAGLGAQHVVAMFGATFVFPLLMGLNPQLAIMMSGIATIVFLLIVQGKVPSYLGTSAAFVGGAAAIYAQGGDPADVTGAVLDRRRGARRRRRADPLHGLGRAARGAAAGRHRRRGDADRLQPRAGRRRRLLAAGPVDRPDRDGRRDLDGGGTARLLRPDRRLPRAGVRLRAVLGLRPVRTDHVGAARAEPARRRRTAVQPGGHLLRGHGVRARPGELGRRQVGGLAGSAAAERPRQRGRRVGTARRSAWPSSC